MLFIISEPEKTAPLPSQTVASLRASPTHRGGLRCPFYEVHTVIFQTSGHEKDLTVSKRKGRQVLCWLATVRGRNVEPRTRSKIQWHEDNIRKTWGTLDMSSCFTSDLKGRRGMDLTAAFCRPLLSPELPAPCFWARPDSHIGLDLFSSCPSHPDPPGWLP